MSTVDVVSLPEKRKDLGQGPIPEQPLEKRLKIDDPASNSNSEGQKKSGASSRELIYFFCEICHVNGHDCWDCPRKSKGMGWYCLLCHGPCKKEDDDSRDHLSVEMVKQCAECGYLGDHWVDDCPLRSDAEVDDPETSDGDYEDDGDWI